MKKLPVLRLFVGLMRVPLCLAQDGTVNFDTRAVGAKVHDSCEGNALNAGWVGQLALVDPIDESLTPIGSPVQFYSGVLSSRKGTIDGGVVAVPGMAGADVLIQFLVWNVFQCGELWSPDGPKSWSGRSNIVPLKFGGYGDPPAPPADLHGLASFTAGPFCVPEPSTYALLLGGLAVLGLRSGRSRRPGRRSPGAKDNETR